jgi:hypothetical protein
MFCDHRNILGKPNEGIHKYRIFNFSIIDIMLTIIAAYILSWLFKANFWATLIILFLLGIILHRIFCVKTTLDKILFK